MLGLATYVGAGRDPGISTARTALAELAAGVSRMSAGATTSWPYRAVLPWALSRSDWHAWGAQMPAGLAAAWFFGQNAAGVPVYDPATGVSNDGVAADGTVNHGSGAESTIHGLLTMQVLDANPDIAAAAKDSSAIVSRDGQKVVEAESGRLTGNAAVVTPASTWTGESQWSVSYVAAGQGSTVSWSLPAADQRRLIQPIVELVPGSTARSTFTAGSHLLGRVDYGAVGAQGKAPSPTELRPIDLPAAAPAAAVTVTSTTRGGTGNVDALLVIPLISTLRTSGDGHSTELMSSVAGTVQFRPAPLPGTGRLTVRSYDRDGRLVRALRCGTSAPAAIWPGGFTIATRSS